MREQKVWLQVLAAAGLLLALALRADAQEFRYQVSRDKLVGSAKGELIIRGEGVEYRAEKETDGRAWAYWEIKLLEILSPTRVRIRTYEDGPVWKLGKDRDFTFDILGAELTQEVSDFLRGRITRPFVTSFTAGGGAPVAEVPVKHLHRFGGCQGVLKIFRDRLVYEAEGGHDSRSWLWKDIRSVGRPDRFRFEVVTYEPQFGGPARNFDFSLKEEMPDAAYDLIWAGVFRPTPLTRPGEKKAEF